MITKHLRQKRINWILPYLEYDWRILDAGCGNGWLTNALIEEGYNCIGVDRIIKRNTKRFIKSDLENLPFKKNFFDCIVSINTLEYCYCENELKRVLKPHGLFLLESGISNNLVKMIGKLRLVKECLDTKKRNVSFRKLPFKLISWRVIGGLDKFGVFINEYNGGKIK